MYPHITTYPLFSGGCSCIKLRTWKVRKSWGLQYLQHLSAVGPAQAMGCQPTNGTNARSAIGVFTMNKIQSQSWVVVLGLSLFFILFHGFIMGLSYFYHVEPYHPYGSNDVRGLVGLAWCESIGPWDDQGWDLRWFNMTWYDLTHTHTFVPHLGHGLKLQ